MKKVKLFQKRKIIFAVLCTLLSIFCVIYYSKECSRGITNGISFCIGVLLPSLFLFMIIASYIVESGVATLLDKPFSKITLSLFRLPGCCSSAIILSLIGGYPVGAKLTYSLYEKGLITQSQAKKLSYFAIGAGPGFLINYIGSALLNNKSIGNILLISQSVSVIISGIIAGRVIKSETYTKVDFVKKGALSGEAFVKSVKNGCSACVNMCAMVVVFSAIIEIVKTLLSGNKKLSDIITALLEITTGCNVMCGKYPLTLIAFMVGFSGICVHFQVFSALKDIRISKGVFFVFRILGGILTAISTYILLMFMPQSVAVFSTTDVPSTPSISTTVWGGAALLVTALCFLGSINYFEKNNNENKEL